MHAIFNVMPYKFWIRKPKYNTYLLVTESDDYCRRFKLDNPNNYETPPYECGDGLEGDNYARKIVDWHKCGGGIQLHLSCDAEDMDDCEGYLMKYHHDDIERIDRDNFGIVVRVKRKLHPDDLFDLLYDMYDSEVEEIHYEGEG